MKKAIFLLTALCVLLAGCSKKAGMAPSESALPSATPAAVESPETGTPNPSASPSETPMPTEAPPTSDTARLSEAYVDIIKSGDYFMKANLRSDSGINAFSVSVRANSTAMETATSEGTVYNTVIQDGTTYMIDHQNKMVITSGVEVSSSASNMAGENLSAEGITFSTKGTADFSGESLPFEEYRTPAGTMRFYFRGTALAGIETREGDTVLLYMIEELSKRHRPSMHNIPQDYPILDMAALGG